ncbi:zinc-ribbon domain-containing protein [Streptomyces sp. 5-8]|uniref:Zinc-ribbon domain-containing protein n=1 Tax=Streptomyces musisoli TaxID=2802280 RepID=A0ABS1PB69_9ACTN|nr:zinc-ribbon domain-containing protein [Streptomyces musisoli]
MSETATCSNCGESIGSEDIFCPKCGARNVSQRDSISGVPERKPVQAGGATSKRPVFPWVFGGIQVIFLIWLIASQNYANKTCPYGEDCARVGSGALALVLILWVIVDAALLAFYFSKKRTKSDLTPDTSRQIVRDYFDAVNSHNYARAWALGGKHLVGGSYDSYVEQISKVANVSFTVYAADGDDVTVRYDSTQTDGTHRRFAGTYTVRGGAIVAAREAL